MLQPVDFLAKVVEQLTGPDGHPANRTTWRLAVERTALLT